MTKEKLEEFYDFIEQKIAESGEESIFGVVKERYPNVSDWEIRQSIMILRGGDVITVDENGNCTEFKPAKNGRSLI